MSRSTSAWSRPLAALGLLAALGVGGCGAAPRAGHAQTIRPQVNGVVYLHTGFAGIPQAGDALGSPRAPYTLFEFADLQCPFCARFDKYVLPAVIRQFVRTGRLRIELHPVVIIGPQSAPAAAAAVAAGSQGQMWEFADLFYRNQRPENSGYVTPGFIAQVASAVPGLNVPALEAGAKGRRVIHQLEANIALANAAGLTGTPNFRLGRTGEVLSQFVRGVVPAASFIRRLRAAIQAR